jgi:hypothetical protein
MLSFHSNLLDYHPVVKFLRSIDHRIVFAFVKARFYLQWLEVLNFPIIDPHRAVMWKRNFLQLARLHAPQLQTAIRDLRVGQMHFQIDRFER